MRVLAITPKVDPADDLLGFIHTWMTRLSRRVEHLEVLQLWSSTATLPPNARLRSLGKDEGVGKLGQLVRFCRIVGQLCLGHEVDAVLTHMGPIFAVCAAPFARAGGQRLVLWYAHGAVSPMLRLAHRLVDEVGTSTPDGFRIPSHKVRLTGQGIDTDRFHPPLAEPAGTPLVSIGRYSPIKDHATIFRALALLRERGLRPHLDVVGGAHLPGELRYREFLQQRVCSLGLSSQISLRGGVPHDQVAATYQQAAIFVSASRTGSLDKAALEALACGRTVLTCNDAFRNFLGPHGERYTFPVGDEVALADRLAIELTAPPADRRARGEALRQQVVQQHGVEHLADELTALLTGPSSRVLR